MKFLLSYILKPFLLIYLRFNSRFHYNGLDLVIFKGVFHPQFFFSSKYLSDFVLRLNLSGKTFCEPCSGSGLIALTALKKAAIVTCFDLNPNSVQNIQSNFERNRHLFSVPDFKVYHSNVFSSIPAQKFDFVVLNPPYFFKNFENPGQMAWNAGEDGQFFIDFFDQLGAYVNINSEIYMILADNCEIDRIDAIAKKYGFQMAVCEKRKILWEMNYIFKIELM